ncbi:UDP-glycosyltransferase 74G1-like [Euphorbia lathyris]|uniref:UDP-glycosyltransferase 74G1-like n=1 Tax=Euphorbia lathyris TaxID=212925 RepID=UPI003313179D
MDSTSRSRAHVVILPYPAQGHINPLLQFAKRLVSKGVKATLANTVFINNSMLADPSSPIQFQTISDGFDEAGYAQAPNADVYLSSLESVGSKTLANLINKLNNSDSPVTAIIYDGFLPWALDVAKQFGVLGVVFLTQSCAVNNIYYHVQRGVLSMPISGSTVSLPGLPILKVSEIPSFVSDYEAYPAWSDTLFNQFKNIDEAHWVLCNSFHMLEEEAVDWMAKRWHIGTIGPTLPSKYLDKRIEDDKDYGISLFKPDTTICMNWLRDKQNGSVVYVSFGSLAEVGQEQMEELAFGLKSSNCYFLWVVRESEQSKLPKNLVNEKGLVVKWCPQLEVLTDKAIGCFVTHCGFNSVLEALSLGVPIVGMPQWTDQPTNAKYVEDVWRIGIRALPDKDGIVRRQVVEACIREVMEKEKGRETKENAKKWKKLAMEAVDKGGTSDQNIDQFVAKLINS